MFKTAFEKISDLLIIGQADSGLIIDANQSAVERLGYDRLTLVSKTIYEISDIPQQCGIKSPEIFETAFIARDCSRIPVEVVINTFCKRNEIYFSVIARDVSCRKQVQEHQELRKYQVLVEAIPDLFFIFDKHGIFLDYKPGRNMDLFVPPVKFLGKSVFDVLPSELAVSLMDNIKIALETGKARDLEYQLDIRGRVRDFEARVVVIGNDRILYIVRDLTERKQMEKQVKQLSWKDSLTGLYNRAYFEREMKRLEEPCFGPVGLFICDVDGLKLVNDSLGHDAGDKILKSAAEILKSCFREDAVIARIGGDEFCTLLPGSSGEEVEGAFALVMESIREYNRKNQEYPISNWS